MLETYRDQLAVTDRAAADAVYQNAAAEQRSFAAAPSGGEGLARMAETGQIDAKRPPGAALTRVARSSWARSTACVNGQDGQSPF